MKKYDPLGSYLRRQKRAEVVMSFSEIERVLGAMLPNSASREAWWGNEAREDTRHVQCRAWLDAGYDASLLSGDRVRFSRRS